MQDERTPESSKTDATQTPMHGQSSESNAGSAPSRRGFLKGATIGAAALTANAIFPGALVPRAEAVEIGPAEDDPLLRGNTLQQTQA